MSKQRHIRILAGRLDRTAGSGVYHTELAHRLAERGYRVSVLCFESISTASACVETISLDRRSFNHVRFWWRFDSWLAARNLKKQLSRLDLESPDVVIGGEHLLLQPHYQLFPQVPWIYLPHSLVVDHEIEHYRLPPVMSIATKILYRRIQRWALAQSSCTLRFTRRGCEILGSYYPRSRSQFVFNQIGIELPKAVQRRANLEVKLLSVGRLTLGKGADILIQTLLRLKGLNWHLGLVGDGPLRNSLQEIIQKEGMAGRIRFHGFQVDPTPWYRQSDLLLFPSRSESLGLVVLEAMSHGTPCLAIRHDGIEFHNVNEDLIMHGVDGLLADGKADFQKCLEEVLQHPDQLPVLGRNARFRVAKDFTWEAHLDRYEELFTQLAPRSRAVYALSQSN